MHVLQLEDEIATFMGTPESITYSDSASTVTSAVPAFSKRGDLIIADEAIHHALATGIALSRSKVRSYVINMRIPAKH